MKKPNFNKLTKNKFIKDLFYRIKDDDVPALGAQLTYYLILAFIPFLIFLLNILSFTPLTGEEVVNGLKGFLPGETRGLLNDIVNKIFQNKNGSLLSFSAIASLWAASTGVIAIIKGLNKAYDCNESRPFWKVRLISIFFTIALSIIILISLLLLVFGEVLWMNIYNIIGFAPVFKATWNAIRLVAPFATMLVLFLTVYLYMPDCKLSLKKVFPGAAVATLGWIVISFIFSIYIDNFSSYPKTYGSLGGVFILLIWIYWGSILILFGGELNVTLTSKKSNNKAHSHNKIKKTNCVCKRK